MIDWSLIWPHVWSGVAGVIFALLIWPIVRRVLEGKHE